MHNVSVGEKYFKEATLILEHEGLLLQTMVLKKFFLLLWQLFIYNVRRLMSRNCSISLLLQIFYKINSWFYNTHIYQAYGKRL